MYLTVLHLLDDNAFQKGIQKSTERKRYGGRSKNADRRSAETQTGVNDSASSGGVKMHRRTGSARAARRMESGAERNAGVYANYSGGD